MSYFATDTRYKAAAPNLAPGVYHISAASQNGAGVVGRNPVEDRSLLPKPVVNLPLGGNFAPQPWVVEGYADTGVFQLKHYGARTGPQDGFLFAYLEDDMASGALGWSIVPTTNGQGYLIRTLADSSRAWVLDEEPGAQVRIGLLSGAERPGERWIFTPVTTS